MHVIGLTGSIGMGKTATAALFRESGVATYDADAAVHQAYAGEAAELVEDAFPGVLRDGAVDRSRLAERIAGDSDALARLESIIHPIVRRIEAEFLARSRSRGHRLVVLDIPLLFETGGEARSDTVVAVTADALTQRRRVLARPAMTQARFDILLARQMPDREKRRRAHFVVETDHGRESARAQVAAIMRALASVG